MYGVLFLFSWSTLATSQDCWAEFVTAAVFTRFSTWAQSSHQFFFRLLPITYLLWDKSRQFQRCSLPLKVSSSLNALPEISLELCANNNNSKSSALHVTTAFTATWVYMCVSRLTLLAPNGFFLSLWLLLLCWDFRLNLHIALGLWNWNCIRHYKPKYLIDVNYWIFGFIKGDCVHVEMIDVEMCMWALKAPNRWAQQRRAEVRLAPFVVA